MIGTSRAQHVAALLAAALARRRGRAAPLRLTRLSGGANNETWRVDFEDVDSADGSAYVLRLALGGSLARAHLLPMPLEADLQRLVAAHGVPTPEITLVLQADDQLGDGYLMRLVPGQTIGGRIVRDPALAAVRPRLAGQCGAIAARLHAIPIAAFTDRSAAAATADQQQVDAAATLFYSDAAGEIERWSARLAASRQARPVFAFALDWLARNCPPPPEQACLVHGDFRNGNLVVDQRGVAAVLDWELAHLGDPMEDLGWLCVNSWRYGAVDLAVGGFGQAEDLFSAYRRVSGRPVDVERVRFWQVMGSLKWGVMCIDMLQIWLDGADRTIDRAAIARRSSEAELDLLRLLAPRGAGAVQLVTM